MAKPVLKWAGGKTVILKEIEKRLNNIETSNACFYDVFAGGASVTIKFHDRFMKCVINDTNKELKHVYDSIKNTPSKLMLLLDIHAENHSHDYFYKIRVSDRDLTYEQLSEVEKAARTIYLNKTCYNGLYRVNSKGQFNVPLGRQKNISIYDKDNIEVLSSIFQKIDILNKDFSVVLKECKAGDIVYIDPPYDKINNLSFVEYNVSRFDEFDQERLKREIDELTEKGVYVIASNSYTENTAKLYKEYIDEHSIIKVKRSIASKNASRLPVEEILIDNIEKVKKNASKN
jgi:DNA adenine methylase